MDQECVSKPVSAIICVDDDDTEPLSGKPLFHVTLCKSHVSATHLPVPKKFFGLLPEKANVPVILTRGSRSWEMKYYGTHITQRRLSQGWKAFIDDNILNVGDVCLFELMSCEVSLIKFKVQVLRGDLPSVLVLDREVCNSDISILQS
ncbi:hypothetical protein RND81_03G240800 [Saponaria officinalis]|uniref:TF-B3 domain-containing protein n=1 Tax=Saponaria officinalis TaxID=3572 RepID=A0AAW1M7A9_SAPOF